MEKLSQIMTVTKNDFFNILLNWEKIAGKSNRDIMIPYMLKNKILYIAVPNSMVEKTIIRFKDQMIENINYNLKKRAVSDIKFTIDISRFGNLKKDHVELPVKKTVLSKKEVAKKAEDLEKTGISKSLAQTLAEIELLLAEKQED